MNTGDTLLRNVHKNAEMGKGTIPQVLEVTQTPALRKALEHQLQEYEKVADRAQNLLQQRGLEAEDPGDLKDFMSGLMIRAKTMTDRSPSHIAEMMIQGSTMGTIQMARKLHSCETADEEAAELANELLRIEEQNIQQMKEFL